MTVTILNKDGKRFAREEVCTILDRPYKTITKWMLHDNLLTFEELANRSRTAHRRDCAGKRIPLSIEGQSANEIADRLGIHYSTVVKWIRNDPSMNIKDIGEKAMGALPKRMGKRVHGIPKVMRQFNRGKFCNREKFTEQCKHYTSCQEMRLEKRKHHKRYNADGSCYDGEVNKCFYQNSSGQLECTTGYSNGIRLNHGGC